MGPASRRERVDARVRSAWRMSGRLTEGRGFDDLVGPVMSCRRARRALVGTCGGRADLLEAVIPLLESRGLAADLRRARALLVMLTMRS